MANEEGQRQVGAAVAADDSDGARRDRGKALEQRIIQSYVWALRVPKDADGRRTVTLSRNGNYEVRLFEPAEAPEDEAGPFRIELFDLARGVRVDGYAGDDIEETACAAEALIIWARLLSAATPGA